MTLLDRIIEHKRREVARSKARLDAATLRRLAERAAPTRDFALALRGGRAPRIIAEVKRASPAKGVLRPHDSVFDWQPEQLAQAYERAGAAALSVLTDVPFFWGHADHLEACRAATALPVLRKDFIIDPYQVDESRWLGADAILLIVAVVDAATLLACAARARELGMAVLVEVHADSELRGALAIEEAIVGVNHRDLQSMQMDMQRSRRLRPQIPSDRIMVAESGIEQPAEITALVADGIECFLVGGSIAASDDPEQALRALRQGAG